jgi:hypothetical protein
MKIVIGIDGGKNGALAVAKGGDLKVYDMPATAKDLHRFFAPLSQEGEVVCFFEKVSAFVGEDDAKKFGIIKMIKQVERVFTVLDILDIKVIEVASVTWQSRLKLNKNNKGLSKTERKRKYYNYAQGWAPLTKFTIKQGDAVCVLACGLKMLADGDPLVTCDYKELELF